MGYNLWADTPDVPNTVAEDARLRDRDAGFFDDAVAMAIQKWSYPDGPVYGQAGWDVGLHFTSLDDLVKQIENTKQPDFLENRLRKMGDGPAPESDASLKDWKIDRLAIHAHGLPGQVFVNGKANTPLTADNFSHAPFKDAIANLKGYLAKNCPILFIGCQAGAGAEGTRFLKEMSLAFGPHRPVVAFVTLGYVFPEQKRRGQGIECEPGMRDTMNSSACGGDDKCQWRNYGQFYKDLSKLPWASESSPRARVATNGLIHRNAAMEHFVNPLHEADANRPTTAWE